MNGKKWIATKPSKDKVHAGTLYPMEIHPHSLCQMETLLSKSKIQALWCNHESHSHMGRPHQPCLFESLQGYQSTLEKHMVSTQRSPMLLLHAVHNTASSIAYPDPVLCTCTTALSKRLECLQTTARVILHCYREASSPPCGRNADGQH